MREKCFWRTEDLIQIFSETKKKKWLWLYFKTFKRLFLFSSIVWAFFTPSNYKTLLFNSSITVFKIHQKLFIFGARFALCKVVNWDFLSDFQTLWTHLSDFFAILFLVCLLFYFNFCEVLLWILYLMKDEQKGIFWNLFFLL